MATLDQLKEQAQLARELGDVDLEIATLERIQEVQKTAPTDRPRLDLRQIGNRAAVSAQPDYTAGLTFMGRGFDNLLTGLEQIALKAGEEFGPGIVPHLSRFGLDQLEEQREREDAVYQPLKERYGASASIGEFVGESAPFLGIPAGRAEAIPGWIGRMAERPIVGAPLRAAPEAALGGAQETSYYDSGRAERGASVATDAAGEAAGMAGAASLATDYLSRRANIRRGRMGDRLQEVYDMGAEEGVPIRTGSLEDQLRAASDAAVKRTTSQGDSVLGQEAIGALETGVAAQAGDFQTAYDMLFQSLDQYGASGSRIKSRAQKLFKEEQARGSMANSGLMSEYRRWMDMPDDQLTIQRLHEYRSGLRDRMKALGPESGSKVRDYQRLEQMVSSEIAREAERIAPGAGDALKNLDSWYYEDVAKIRRMPGVTAALGENPTPANFLNWLMTKPNPGKRQAFQLMTESGQNAVKEAAWNRAFRQGMRGKEFSPLAYARYIEDNTETMAQYFQPEELLEFTNLGKLMRHIATEGKTADNNLLRLLRGFPFMYRAVTDAYRRSNFRYALRHAPPDIRPGSPEMETFYRGLIRSIVIQDEATLEDFGAIPEEVGRAAEEVAPEVRDRTIGRLGL